MRDLDNLFNALAGSKFRSRQRLGLDDRRYLAQKTMAAVIRHARRFVLERLAPSDPANDGKQTPMRGHPVFVAQHATATCCRGCLAKWHKIPAGRSLSGEEVSYVVCVVERWLLEQQVEDQRLPLFPDG